MRDKNTPGTDATEFVKKGKLDTATAQLDQATDDYNDLVMELREEGFVVELEIEADDEGDMLVQASIADPNEEDEAETETETGTEGT